MFSRRDAPELCIDSPSFKREGAGKAGCRLHPRSCARKAHEWTTGSTGSLRLSLREWFTAYFALSSVTGLVCHRRLRGLTIHPEPGWAGCISARLDASTGAPGPHDFAVRDRPGQSSCRASCHPASSGKDGWQRRSSARRPIAHGKTRPAIPLRARRCRVHRIPPRVRDDSRSAPFRVGRGELVEVICPTR